MRSASQLALRVLAVAVLALAACHSVSDRQARGAAAQSKALPGLSVKLSEYSGGEVIPHTDDSQHPTHAEKVGVTSKLTLDFQAPQLTSEGAVADPRWDALGNALEQVKTVADEYRAVNELVARTAADASPAAVQAVQDRVRAARDAQSAFFNGLVDTGLMTRAEFTAKVIEIGRNPNADAFEMFAEVFRAKREALHAQAAALANSTEMLVTVRAKLDPLIGDVQLLQVPGYYEKSADDLHDDQSRARSAEMDRLKVEFEASQRVVAALHELEAKNASIRGAARAALDKLGQRMRSLREFVDGVLAEHAALLESVLADAPAANAELTPSQRQLWNDLRRLHDDVEMIRKLPDALLDLGADDPFAAVEEFRATLAKIREHLTGSDSVEAWPTLAARLPAELAAVARETANGELKPKLEQLAQQIAADLTAVANGLLTRLPQTQAALDALHATGVFSHALGGLGDVGTEIPRPFGELQPAKLDLRKNPIGDGDTLELQVQVWEKATYDLEPKDPARRPAETITFTNEAIRTGWRWSGDVIFTQPLDGAFSDAFTANAAVSREYHWYSRAEPDEWFNRLDPGVGFHAAQLDMSPNTTTEIGVGVNASIWNGLIRSGIGYNISVGGDRGYWYFGFGLISALDRLNDLGERAFGSR